jgi:ribose 5-phosphate isomerase A
MAKNPKQLAGEHAAESARDGMVVGLGTGSTAYFAIERLGERVKEGLRVRGIATSEQSLSLAVQFGVPLVDFADVARIDLTIDGADEVDPAFNLTKGGGGALLREKIVASASELEVIVVDETKLVDRLGAFPLPVEVVPFGWRLTQKHLAALGCEAVLRRVQENPYVTDNGNYILDASFGRIGDPPDLERRIRGICGVVECGLFIGLAHRIVIGREDGSVEERTEPRPL